MAIYNFAKTSSTPGTPVQISTTPIKCNWVLIEPVLNGGSVVYHGGRDVSSSQGDALAGGEKFLYPPAGNANQYNLADIWFDPGTSGDGVKGIYNVN